MSARARDDRVGAQRELLVVFCTARSSTNTKQPHFMSQDAADLHLACLIERLIATLSLFLLLSTHLDYTTGKTGKLMLQTS